MSTVTALAALKQTRRFHDESADSLEALAVNKPEHFTACDTAADNVCLIAFTFRLGGL
ncbi:hypothetical protein [Paraburkholderia sp. HP33-1]|uniref:hypothetical protein n=1 Tax=Paraburkholderia sp. HP33-1 TaxID=2883243 RepID=UPI001F1B436E|nr:hypothetical protein [Paraburkholderia sp. HP33-1]